MITQEIKERVFLLYPYAKVQSRRSDKIYSITGHLLDRNLLRIRKESQKNCDIHLYISEVSLLLKPLSSISDIDAIEVAKLNDTVAQVWNGKVLLKDFGDRKGRGLNVGVIDFLRSKGYALPYLNYSVEDLINEGIFKLVEA